MVRRCGLALASVLIVVITFAGFTASAAGSPASGDWPQYGDGPAHNSVNRAENVLTTATVPRLHVTHVYSNWTPLFTIGSYQVIVGNLGYSVDRGQQGAGNSYVDAYNLPSGTRAWRHVVSSHDEPWRYVPAVSQGILYVGGASAMYALDAHTGRTLWTATVSSNADFNETTVNGGIVYGDTYRENKVYAFNAADGRLLWSATPPGCCLIGAVTVAGGLAYVVSGRLIAYNATTGALAFQASASEDGHTPTVSGGVAYVLSLSHLDAFNATTGKLLWSVPVAESSSDLTADGSTLVLTTTRYVIALAAATGARLWTFDGGSNTTFYSVAPIANGVVYATSLDHGLQALRETTGAILYQGGGDCNEPVVSHGAVYAPCSNVMTVYSL